MVQYVPCPKCKKRGFAARPMTDPGDVRARCRYCKFQTTMSSFDFWVGIWGKDAKVQADRRKALKKLNDAIRDHMKKTGQKHMRLRRVDKNECHIEFY